MSTQNFKVKAHKFPGQHIRQYPGATRHREEDVLFLEAKQYTPLSNPKPQEGDVTILATHAVSFPKELYEPLWDDLLEQSGHQGFRVRSIWVVDASNQGASGVINERTQGDDPSFFDHPRDLLHMINLFRGDFPQPVVGIGHSMGGTALIQLAHLHPRLLSSLVLFDPVLGINAATDFASVFYLNSIRPDLWPSQEMAEKTSRALFRSWNPRVLDKWMKHGLRNTPTLAHPEPSKVTLQTSKAQGAWTYGRSWFDPLSNSGSFATLAARAKYPDMHDGILQTHPFYRPEDAVVWNDLPRLRPGVFYVSPETGPMIDEKIAREKLSRTGCGPGGSGGTADGRVSSIVLKGTGHLLPFEKPVECARLAAEWLSRDLKAWQERATFEREHRDNKSVDKVTLSDEWIKQTKLYFLRSKASGKAKL
ncbi:hypothetical protein B0A50_05431 [Salinomyces thailandicus]|uniref:AB hydrolase-1 domain-containing protein n=1 Tax=Salinomyces thailandicus TaxID=706561 RepID=A0A4U0TTM1_9PEZI|nr:hypothetical protein B0A50_05431 [Salinomyces thailandica]